MDITDAKGVDNVLEIGGAGTFEKSIASAKVNGIVSMIGILSGLDGPTFNLSVALNLLRIYGIYVGSVDMFKSMLNVISEHKIQPVVDQVFDFDDALDAYRYLASAKHFGKIVIINSR